MQANVDWDLARNIAGRLIKDDPFDTPELRETFESDMLELTPQAEELVEAETGLVSAAGKAKARITDRAGWIDANLNSFDRLLRPLLNPSEDEPKTTADGPSLTDRLTARLGETGDRIRPVGNRIETGVLNAIATTGEYVGPKVAAAQVGALLGWMSGRVLGQYDLLIIEDERPEEQDLVYYVAPNMMDLEDRFGFPAKEFRLWVAVHECTHRAQFTGVEWLRPYFLSLVNELLDSFDTDTSQIMETVRQLIEQRRNGHAASVKDGGLAALFQTTQQKEIMAKVSGLMSLLEGHGDITMDRAGKDLIPSQARFSRVMSERRKNASGLNKLMQRLTGIEAKLAQYEEGESFIHAVEAAGGKELFDQVWQGPENLPNLEEVRQPQLWIDRINLKA